MDDKSCKKCGGALAADATGPRCDSCAGARRNTQKAVGIAIGAGAVAVIGAAVVSALTRDDDEDGSNPNADVNPADLWDLPRSQVEKLFEAVEDGKVANSWIHYNRPALERGTLSVDEVIYFGGGTSDDD